MPFTHPFSPLINLTLTRDTPFLPIRNDPHKRKTYAALDMNPTPSKRPRPSASPPTTSSSKRPSSRAGHTASPSNTLLPAPTPSPLIPPPQPHPHPHAHFIPPSSAAGPSDWQSRGGWSGQRASRRSIDAGMSIRSPATEYSEDLPEGEEVESGSGMQLSRDLSTRAPRSMMACTRCRRQK
jgi:hypothetical protein